MVLLKGIRFLAGFRCVVRDNNYNIIKIIGVLWMSDFMGLGELKRIGVRGCAVKGNSAVVIS